MFFWFAIKEFFYSIKTSKYDWKYIKLKIKNKDKDKIIDLRKSLSLRVIDAGDDEWTMAELYSLESPKYSLWNLWVNIVASPKHADGLLIVWAISDNMKNAVKDAFDVVPSPKIIIALWDKAINWDSRFYWSTNSTKSVLWRVDLEIPWDPPKAEDIYDYIKSFINELNSFNK